MTDEPTKPLVERVATWTERHESLVRFKGVTRPEREAFDLLREQQDEIERLTKIANDHAGELDSLGVAHDSLRRDLEAARVDAERYRYWRDGCVSNAVHIAKTLANAVFARDFDAAIDKARKGE